MSTLTAGLRDAAPGLAGTHRRDSTRVDLWVLWLSFAFAVFLTFASTVDDPFITLRYAHNLLAGHGAVFNPGDRVNGATSPAGLLMALVAVGLPSGYAMLKLKLLSLLFGALTVGWSKKLIDGLSLAPLYRRVALGLVGASPIIGFSSASGLESTLEAFALVGLVVELRSGRAFARPVFAAVFAAVATASRPEALLLVMSVAAVALLLERPLSRWVRIRWAAPAVATAVAVAGANLLYYRSAVPNTYYAKHVPLGQALRDGFGYLEHGWELGYASNVFSSFGHILLSAVLAAVAGAFLVGGLAFAATRVGQFGYFAAVCLAQVLFILESGGDWIEGSRFLLPIVPFILPLALAGIERAGSVTRRPAAVAAFLLAPLGFTTLFPYDPAIAAGAGPVWAMRGVDDHSLVAHGGYGFSGLWSESPALLSCVPKGGLVAATEVGYLGFARPDLRILDLRGLVSREISAVAPASARHYYGVQDWNWGSLASPIGKTILASNPDAILAIDSFLGPVLGGKYRYVASDSAPVATLSLYARVGGPCDRPLPTG